MAEKNPSYSKHIFKYSNGAVLVYAHNPLSKTTQAHIGFRCGSQCDGENKGLSHLLEHMLFNGEGKDKRSEIIRLTDTYFNAHTSLHSIDIDFNCPSVNLSTIMQIGSEMLFQKHFDKKELENEKKVVLHEFDYNSDMSIIDSITSEYERNFFINIAYPKVKKDYQNTDEIILGNEETLSKITPEILAEYSDKYFVSENMIMSVVSSLPFDQIKEMCDKYFMSKVVSKPENKVIPVNYINNSFIRQHRMTVTHRQYVDECQINLLFRSPKYPSSKVYLLDLLNDFIFNDEFGLLQKKLRLSNGLTYTPYQYGHEFNNHLYSVIYFATDPEHGIEALKIVTSALGELVEKGISQSDLDKFKLFISSRLERQTKSFYSSENLFFTLVENKTPFETLKLDYESLTLDEVNEHIRNLYGMSKICLTIDGNVNRLQHIHTQEEIRQIIQDIYDEPLTVPEEVLNKRVAEFNIENTNSIISIPSLSNILADFHLKDRILKQMQSMLIKETSTIESFSQKYRTLPKANLEIIENEDEELTE